jgi:polysaccharide export outer membrane protein
VPLNARRWSRTIVLLTSFQLLVSCHRERTYVWVDDFKGSALKTEPITITSGDVVQVRVFNQEQLSARTRVRADGKITLPLINDVEAAGYTPRALAVELERRFKDLVRNPVITVSIEERRPTTVLVVGEVTKPGVYPIDEAPGLLRLLVNAGGLTQDASNDRIFVVREGVEGRIRFRYDTLLLPTGKAKGFKLEVGDVVVVE